jgi:cell division protein FtsX
VIDLDTQLERLAAEATRDAVPPEAAALARRGRRRRRRQLAGSALVVAAVVAAGLVLPARLTGRTGDLPRPTAPPATDVAGAATVGGYWFGKTDASVFLEEGITPARRQAIRERIERLDAVDQVYFESRAEAYDRLRQLYRAKPEVFAKIDPATLPESFRVRLGTPEQFKRLFLALCRPDMGMSAAKSDSGKLRCMDGVDSVVEDAANLKPLLVGRFWFAVADLTVVLPEGTSDARQLEVQARLEAMDGVKAVTYQSPAQTYRQLPEKVRKHPQLARKLTPETLPASFRVTLDEPRRVGEFHRALCGSLRTGDCADGLVVLEHPRRR